ncbi:MAG: F-type H+-transporting ATPase subunit b [Alphaproteobacteria bacterium]|nr:MAG: F-type H+-transporting ATPase subunit b [Alphaproteobacteria bacterium]
MKRAGAWLTAALWCIPALALAEGEHGGEHGGRLHLIDILAGEDSVHFWGAVLNWLLLVVILVVFARKPVRAFLGARRSVMEDAIREASAAKAQAQARYDEYTARLAQLDQELARLRADILQEAQHASARLKSDTETLVRQHAEALERQVRGEVVTAAVAAAERVLRESIQPTDQQRLADAYREDVARGRSTRGQA